MKLAKLRSPGFSLVEVTLALGVASFAALSILAAMSSGTAALRRAVDTTVQSQIAATVLGGVAQMDFSKLEDIDGQVTGYDNRGFPLTNASDGVYSATTKVERGVTLPGAPGSNTNLARITLTVVQNGRSADAFLFSTTVANNGL